MLRGMKQPSGIRAACCTLALIGTGLPLSAAAVDVRMCTDRGAIEISLDERAAPLHARNFARNVDDGFYSGTILHRVVPDSMVQGGSYTTTLERRPAQDPITSEARNGLSNLRGTIAASRAGDSASGSTQFFINLSDNTHLDATADTPGYTVFGRVTAGLEILDDISRQPTRTSGSLADLPVAPVELTSVTTLTRESFFGLSVEASPADLARQFEAAVGRSDAAAILASIDALRQGCETLSTRQYLAEAEAAIELDRIERARYSLAQYLAGASRADPQLSRMQRLYAGLPAPGQSNIAERAAQCRRPAAPTIPPAWATDFQTLSATERTMRSYHLNGDFYLRCVGQMLDSGDLNATELRDATVLYNEVVIEMTAVTSRFNASVRAFKEAND